MLFLERREGHCWGRRGQEGRVLLGQPKPFFPQESPNLGGQQLLKHLHWGFSKQSGAWHLQCWYSASVLLPPSLGPDFGRQQTGKHWGWGTGTTCPLRAVFPLSLQARFTVDCHFRERFQENSYNTYASAVHRSPRSGRQWYVALNKRGKAKRGCSPRARPQHVSTHFLPRFWQPQPPELAFTVALPEKKPPPPKPKVVPSPPRKNPGPVKYRLKFRFG